MTVIKTIVNKIIKIGNYFKFSGDGRAYETLGGTTYQHYGFKSFPKSGTEIIVLKFENNALSVAENDADLAPTLQEGQVAIYADGNNDTQVSIVMTPNGNGSSGLLNINCKTGTITINAGNNVSIVSPSVSLGDTQGLQKLCNETFASLLAGHTHALDVPHGVTLAPLQYSGPAVSPVNSTLYPDSFTSNTEAK